ncbi:aspartate/glutamate racemase family protein [Cupriavidus sp. WKF15]|uniref:aspartate/glutamate racemase family protein n=1 Tax=Cupriavidus sp. WKF15 TaxID=3032282 RepID=UPI0023E280ED|nr:aspartate/glutamate racemase family protein [Cupriavidus sp. WKF15]WER47039.1 aspartate/glutamate racemase family protein [Cupriavidus sp. WKF15]
MAARIAFVHTVGFLVDEFKRLMRAQLPDIDCFHILNESLLQDLLRGSEPTLIHRRVVSQVHLAIDAGADLVVMTCSSTSPAIDIARQTANRPILKIDDPMAAEAVNCGPRIGLLCTATSTVAPSTSLLLAHAELQGRTVAIHPHVNADAYRALMAGDRATHDVLVHDAAVRLSQDVDVLVLAQASLAPLRDSLAAELDCPVLSSPPLLMRELTRHLALLA